MKKKSREERRFKKIFFQGNSSACNPEEL